MVCFVLLFFFFQAEDGIRDTSVTGVQTCALPISPLDPLALSFQLKLLWLSGYLPHLTSCAECGGDTNLAGYSPKSGGALCAACADGALPLSPQGLHGIEALLNLPVADAGRAPLRP